MRENFKSIYEFLIDTNDIETTITKLEENKFKETIERIIDIPNQTHEELEYIIKILQYVYNNSDIKNLVSDAMYDILYERYLEYGGHDIIGSVVSSDRKTAEHKYPDLRGTLDKVYWLSKKYAKDDRKTLHDWMTSLVNRYDIPFDVGVDVVILPKWDGVSLIFENDENGVCQMALTRGDVVSNKAVDLSDYFKGIKFNPIPEGVPFGLKTECVVSDEQFENLNNTFRKFATKRNAVSGLINNKDISKDIILSNISLKALQYQPINDSVKLAKEMMEDISMIVKLSFNELDRLQDKLDSFRAVMDVSGFDYDGVVIRIADETLQKRIGRQDHINKYEVALKFPAPQTYTTLEDIEFQIGLLGALTPVAKITPTRINGKVVSSASLGSIDRCRELNLSKGDTVILMYDIIPYIVPFKSNGGEKIEIPTHCPICNQPLTESPVLGCYNKSCDINKIGLIHNYCVKMNIPNISSKRIHLLYKLGYLNSIEDLYKLKYYRKEITSIKGLGEKIFANIISSIDSRRIVFDYELLGSLGIRGIGRKIFKRISSIYYINELIEICSNNNIKKLIMEGIQDETAIKIINGINDNLGMIEFLRSELTVKNFKDTREESDKNKIHVYITGIRDREFEKHLQQKGIVVLDGYSKKVDLLIYKDYDKSPSKIEKAKKQGKDIVSIDEAYDMFKFKK